MIYFNLLIDIVIIYIYKDEQIISQKLKRNLYNSQFKFIKQPLGQQGLAKTKKKQYRTGKKKKQKIMNDEVTQKILIQQLNAYLQYFKQYFYLSYQLIQHHLFFTQPPYTNHNITNNNIIQRITQKYTHPRYQFSPFLLYLTQTNKSYIDRFHMRIIEYLQYRFNNLLKSFEKEHKFHVVVNTFLNNLHKIFRNIIFVNKNNDKQKTMSKSSIGNIFIEIEHCVKNFFISMFKYLQKMNYNKDDLILQQLISTKNAIQSHVMLPFYQYLTSFHIQQTSTHHNIYKQQNHYNWKTHNRSKSQFNIQPMYSLKSKSLRQSFQNRQIYENNRTEIRNQYFGEKLVSQYQQEKLYEQNQKYKKTNKSSYAQMLSIMQIQNVQVYSRDYIMSQLKAKNVKNKSMISKFLKLYRKKQKKHKHKHPLIVQKQCFTQNVQNLEQTQINHTQKKISLVNINCNVQQQSINEKEEVKVKVKDDIQQLSTDDNPYSLKQKIIAICGKNKQQPKIINTTSPQPINTANSKSINKKLTPKLKSQTFKHINPINPIITNQSQLESNKNTFLYKQKEKLYFQQLKYKMNLQFQKVSSSSKPLQLKKDYLQLQTLKKLNKMPGNKFIISDELKEKLSQQNLSQRTTIKGSNFSSFIIINEQNKINSRSYHSNSQLLNKNQLILQNTKNNLQTLSSLQCSSLQKLMPKRRLINLNNIKQNGELKDDNKLDGLVKCEQKIKSNSQIQNAVVVLPRIVVLRKKKESNYQKLSYTDK